MTDIYRYHVFRLFSSSVVIFIRRYYIPDSSYQMRIAKDQNIIVRCLVFVDVAMKNMCTFMLFHGYMNFFYAKIFDCAKLLTQLQDHFI